jgi:hypothetical protein
MNELRWQAKLVAFSEGKRLRRYRGMVRNPLDSTCDACGSALPNNLFGLRDTEGKRDYFVGGNCLGELSKMLVVERPFVRADIKTAYEEARLNHRSENKADLPLPRRDGAGLLEYEPWSFLS